MKVYFKYTQIHSTKHKYIESTFRKYTSEFENKHINIESPL